jgi:dCMP deaminase
MKQKMIEAHMDCAERYARLSTARRLKVGALVVKDDRVISIGYNGTAPGADNNCEIEPENWDGDIRTLRTKPNVIHAECNALAKLVHQTARIDGNYAVSVTTVNEAEGADLFCNFACCKPCAEAMIAHGIKRFFYRYAYRDTEGLDYLEQNGVEVKQIV